MNRTKKILYVFILALVPLLAQARSLGFLSDADIRDSGMAGVSAPFASGASGSYVNPACLAAVPMQSINLSYYPSFESSVVSSLSYAFPLLEHGTIGASALILDSGSIDEKDDSNVLLGTFSDTYTEASVSYGLELFQYIYSGVTARYINHSLYGQSGGCFTSDFGAVILFPYDIRVSLLAGNLFKSSFKYSSGASDTLPLFGDVTAGVSMKVIDGMQDCLRLACGVSREEYDSASYYHAGAEYSFYGMFALRCGLNSDGLDFGASININHAEFNYALVQKPLGLSHRFSLGYSFGEDVRAIESQIKTKESKAKYELIEKIRIETLEKFEQEINASIESGDFENAKISTDKALVWAPGDPWFTEKSREISVLINADKVKTYMAEADAFIKKDSYIDALVSLKNVLDIDPKNQDALTKMQRAQELIRTLGEKNLSVQEGNKEAIRQHFESGLNNYASGNFDKAIEEWDKVIKASPLQRLVYAYIQSAQDKVKKIEQAQTQKKMDKDKKLQSLYNDAVLQYSKGEFEKSIGLWREYLKQDPDNKDARENLEKITKEYMELQKQKLEW